MFVNSTNFPIAYVDSTGKLDFASPGESVNVTNKPNDQGRGSVTWLSGNSLSSPMILNGNVVTTLYINSSFTLASGVSSLTLTAQVSPGATDSSNSDISNWYDLYDESGNEVQLSVGPNIAIGVPPSLFVADYRIRFRTGTSSSPVKQGANASLEVAYTTI